MKGFLKIRFSFIYFKLDFDKIIFFYNLSIYFYLIYVKIKI